VPGLDFWGEDRPDGLDLLDPRLVGRSEAVAWLPGRDCLSGDPTLEDVLELIAELFVVDLVELELEYTFMFMEVKREVRDSLLELSFKKALAESKDFGGEVDLEEAFDDFLLDATEDVDAFLEDAIEDFLTGVCPILTMPRLIASSRAISFPVSGSV